MLLDTSGLLCYFDGSEERHQDAVIYFDAAQNKLTHNYVLAEFVPLCQSRGLPRLNALRFLDDLTDTPEVEVVWVDEELHRLAVAYLRQRPDKRYSLCDVVSFLLMPQRGISEALTTDHPFEQAGLQKLL